MAKYLIIISMCFCAIQATNRYAEFTQSSKQSRRELDFNFNFNTNISSRLCNTQLAESQNSFEKNELWARQIRDAWGKVPSGMLWGNYFDLGNFDQCIDVRHYSNEVGVISGQHCTLMIPYDLGLSAEPRLATPSRSTDVILRVGICVPQSCSADEVRKFSEEALVENFNLTLEASYNQDIMCSARDRNLTYVSSGVRAFAISFFAFILLLVLASTIYEIVSNIMGTKVKVALIAFSIYTNSKIILTMKPLKQEILFLHGLRSIAIISIVWGHAFSIDFWMAPLMNVKGMLDKSGHPVVMIIFAGYLGVDTFLVLSSLLMSMTVFRELDQTRKINIPVLYLKRYFRITVPLAAAILFNVGIYMDLSDGPFWKLVGDQLTMFCVDGWWTNLIYLANYLRPGQLCFGHSWYLMVDMQLYFLSPLVLYPIWRWKKRIGLMIGLIFTVASSSVIYIIVMYLKHDFRTSSMSDTGSLKEVLVYTKPIGRLGSWMMGILVGYLLHLCEGRTITISSKLVSLGWTLTTLLFFTVIFAQYPLRQENYLNNPLIADALYDAFKPIVWGLVIGWIIIACYLSHGNIIKRFLCLSLWAPISKLSFCIYLMHVPVQAFFLATLRSPVHFTLTNGLYRFYGNFAMSFFLALFWALMFEYPSLKIITILVSQRKYRQQRENHSPAAVQTQQ